MPRHKPIRTSSRTVTGSAAAHFGIIGLPDPGRGPYRHDGGLFEFCREFNAAADHFLNLREQRDARAHRERRAI